MEVAPQEVNYFLVKNARKYLTYAEISELLHKQTGIYLSPNTIRKRLKKCGMPSRSGPTIDNIDDVKTAAKAILQSYPVTIGYRSMTDLLRREGMHVRRDTVMECMRDIDPSGVNFRRNRRKKRRIYRSMRPNHVWHIDGYDKLKPFGFPIHGCIDGFSRKVLWLTVGSTNNDPQVVAQNYISSVQQRKGCPLILKVDPGTENSIIGAIQCTLRHNATDCFAGIGSFDVVKSTFNQRIEAWWSMLRRHKMEWWIQFFKELEAFQLFNRENDRELFAIRYTFMPLLQTELDIAVDLWNNHFISRSRQAECPNGRPNVLYHLPASTGAIDCLQSIDDEDYEWLNSMKLDTSRSGSEEFDRSAGNEFINNQWSDADHWEEALYQYQHLIQL